MGRFRQQVGKLWRGEAPVLHVLAVLVLVYAAVLLLPGDGGIGTAAGAMLSGIVVGILSFNKVRRQLHDSAGLPAALFLVLVAVTVLSSGLVKAVGALVPVVPAFTPYQPPLPKVVVKDGTFVATGEIDYQIYADLKRLTARYPQIRTVALDSGGGHVPAGRAIGLLIAGAGLDTRVTGRCFSACTLAFAGGGRRHLGPDGQLGFHGYRSDSRWRLVTQTIDEAERQDRAFLQSRGIAADFLQRAYATPPDRMWWPDRSALFDAGVLTP